MPCINLEEALKLSTEFSVHSSQGEVPADLLLPVPYGAFCEFQTRPWGDMSEHEREAFKKFYLHVGEGLEDIAAMLRQGAPLDETIWANMTGQLTQGN